jgi:hypothetical protein
MCVALCETLSQSVNGRGVGIDIHTEMWGQRGDFRILSECVDQKKTCSWSVNVSGRDFLMFRECVEQRKTYSRLVHVLVNRETSFKMCGTGTCGELLRVSECVVQ